MQSKKNVDAAWEKGKRIRRRNPDAWRKDSKGDTIRIGSYGTVGKFGWELDHKKPKSSGGSDNPQNIQPLHWKENRKKSNKYPT